MKPLIYSSIAMMLLMTAQYYLRKRGLMRPETERGVTFWAVLYIPVVVAMAAQQDMVAALRGGPVAVLSAIAAVAVTAVVIALINRSERQGDAPVSAPMLHDNPLLTEAE